MNELPVTEVMTRDVFAVAPETSLETAARLLAQKRIHGAPVLTTDGTVVGVVSLSDLVDPDRERGHEEGHSMYYTLSDGWAAAKGDVVETRGGRVEEVMTPGPLTIEASASIVDASARMLHFGVHRLLVLDEGVLVGVVSMVDLVRGFLLSRISSEARDEARPAASH